MFVYKLRGCVLIKMCCVRIKCILIYRSGFINSFTTKTLVCLKMKKGKDQWQFYEKKNCETIFSQQGILNQILCKCYTIYLHRFSNKTTSKLFLEDLMSALLHTIFALPRFGLTKVLKIVNKPFLDNLVKLTFLLFFNP